MVLSMFSDGCIRIEQQSKYHCGAYIIGSVSTKTVNHLAYKECVVYYFKCLQPVANDTDWCLNLRATKSCCIPLKS